jgi:hypothetical protein
MIKQTGSKKSDRYERKRRQTEKQIGIQTGGRQSETRYSVRQEMNVQKANN